MEKLEYIAHVDDDSDMREIIKLTLEVIGKYRVEQFSSGEDLLGSIDRLSAQLFLLDYMMPGMNGEKLWDRINAIPTLERVPVIFMTAKAEKSLGEYLMGKGALAVITKPFEARDLCRQLEVSWSSRYLFG